MKRLIKYTIVISTVIISIILLIAILNFGIEKPCPSSRGERMGSQEIAKRLFKEVNLIYNKGAIGGSICSVYLTDSTSFRKYIGKENDNEGFIILYYERLGISEDIVLAIKYAESVDTTCPIRVIDCKSYALTQLKESGSWE